MNSLLTLLTAPNSSPTISPDTADAHDFGADTTPTIQFTPSDVNGDDVRVEAEISDSAYFDALGVPAIGDSTQNSGASGDVSVALPVGNVGDKLVVVVTINGQSSIGDNNGGTALTEDLADYQPNPTNGHTISVFSRVLTGSEPTTLSFTNSGSSRWAAVAFIVRAGYDVAPSSGNAANTDDAASGDISAPSISVANNSVHIVVAAWDTSAIGTISTPAGYTLIENANGGGEPLHVSYKNFSTGGSTGSVACSNTEFGARIAFSFSLKSRSTVFIDKVSGTDAGFANDDDGGDTDPFTQGDQLSFTVQAGDALAVGTYYWRARAKDPTGTNQWSAWTTVRSLIISGGGTPHSITKSLMYAVLASVSPTKSLKYCVATTPTAKTKSAQYAIVKTTAPTKSLQYALISTPTAKTKSLKYTIPTTPAAKTKALAYSIVTSASKTKGLIYDVVSAPTAKTKSLKYCVATSAAPTKSLKYAVTITPTAKTKSLRYCVATSPALTKSLQYVIEATAPVDITKSLAYAVFVSIEKTKSLRYGIVLQASVTKSLRYAVTTPANIQKAQKYSVTIQQSKTEPLAYSVTVEKTIQRAEKYTVVIERTIQRDAEYKIVSASAVQKSLSYVVESAHAIQKSLGYIVVHTFIKTKSLRYVLRVYPYKKKNSPFSGKSSPFVPKSNPYERKNRPYSATGAPYVGIKKVL